MRNKAFLIIAFVVSIPLGLLAQDEGYYPYSFARLSYVNGSVYVQRTSDLGYEKGEINLALVQGDKMGTEDGQAEVHFGRRNYLRLDADTKVEFAKLPKEGDERLEIHILEGSAYLRVSHLAVDKGMAVHTPDASFYVLEEGLYRFNVAPGRETAVFVHEGSLEAAAEDGSALVRDKETAAVSEGRLLGDPEYFYARHDVFDDWNGSRDAQLAQRSERQYLPSGLEEYEEELDENGTWVYERPYGNVWVPRVSYGDWRPYLYGRWVWYPVIGWTWVSSEPWGWSVYHYGRWHWRFGLGWYWIPQHYWGPAWVHWWWDSSYIGWCPLGWYNYPVYLADNRFYPRHHDPYFPAHNRAMTVVRRGHLQSPELARRQVGAGEMGHISKVSLKGVQPSIRPAVNNSSPHALAAKRALAGRPGGSDAVRSIPPANSVSSSRPRPGGASSGVREGGRGASVVAPDRGSVSRPAGGDAGSGGRAIRSYPSQGEPAGRGGSGASGIRRDPVSAAERRSVSAPREPAVRVVPPRGQSSASPKAEPGTSEPKTRPSQGGSKGSEVRKGATIKNYPSNSGSLSASLTARPASPSRTASYPASSRSGASSVRSSSFRASGPASSNTRSSSTSRPSSSSYSRPSPSRSSPSAGSRSPSYSRPSPSRSSSPSPSRSSYAAPSRSGGSSSGRPSRVAGSNGSSSARSSQSSSSRSSSSSSSSSKSGSVKKKG